MHSAGVPRSDRGSVSCGANYCDDLIAALCSFHCNHWTKLRYSHGRVTVSG